jgi:thymidylate synthase
MKQYHDLLRKIKKSGVHKGDRTGTGTQSLFGTQSHYDLRVGFPLVTTKKIHLRSVIHELLWMLKGLTNLGYLHENKVSIWDEWADSNGNLGPVYGSQWRHWRGDPTAGPRVEYEGGNDQIANLVSRLKSHPDCRRLIVTAWDPDLIEDQALPPCHVLFQCWTRELENWERIQEAKRRGFELPMKVEEDKKFGSQLRTFMATAETMKALEEYDIPTRGIKLQLYQRSCDVFLGVPFNIAAYALLTHMLAQVVNMAPLEFIHVYGDVHIYANHHDQVDLQLSREPRPLPRLWLNPDVKAIEDFTYDDIKVEGYQCHAVIKAPVAV